MPIKLCVKCCKEIKREDQTNSRNLEAHAQCPEEFRCEFCRRIKPIGERVKPYGIARPLCCRNCKPVADQVYLQAAAKKIKSI